MRAIALLLSLAAMLGVKHQEAAIAQEIATDKPQTLAERVSKLESEVQLHTAYIDGLESRVPPRGAFIDCNTKNYVQALPATGYLPFLVNCDNVEPYLEGFRITINIGNPHSVAFTQATGEIGYGDTVAAAWLGTKRVLLPATTTIAPASWNRVQVTINPVAAQDMRHLWLEFNPVTASLSR